MLLSLKIQIPQSLSIHALVLANKVYESKSWYPESQKWMNNQYDEFIQRVL